MSASGKPSINRFRSDNSTYSGGDTIRIEIPCGRKGQYLFPKDSFIELKVRVNSGNAGANTANSSIYIDGSCLSLFSRMRIMHGSNVLEDTLYCNKLWNALYDLQINETKRRGESIMKLVGDNTAAANSIFNNGLIGTKFVNHPGAAVAAETPFLDACFCIPSALLGSLAEKALPIGLCGASSIYLELELAPTTQVFVADGSATLNSYTVADIYYNGKITTLPNDIDDLLIQSTGGVINLPAISYKTEAKTMGIGTTAFNDKFSFQYSSLKNFIFFVQNSATANGVLLNRSVTSRPKCNISEFFLLINGEAFPSQSIQSTSRMYAELLRAFDGLTDTGFGGILNAANYSTNAHVTAEDVLTGAVGGGGPTTLQKRFIAGIDLDRFNHSSSTLLSGSSSIGQMVTLQLNIPNPGLNEVCTLFAAVQYDVLYHIEQGLIVAKI